jgi:hypothetical protein
MPLASTISFAGWNQRQFLEHGRVFGVWIEPNSHGALLWAWVDLVAG